MALATRTIRTVYPCCPRKAFLHALTALPRECYTRTCPECHTTYVVKRRTLTASTDPIIVDALDWLDTATLLYTRHYGG